MYSNQKDQVNLEQVYSNIHNDKVVEEGISGVYPDQSPMEILGVGAVYASFFLPAIIDYVLTTKYPEVKEKLKLKGSNFLNNLKNHLTDKIKNDKSLDTMKKNAEDHGGTGSDDYYRQINQKIANDIRTDQTFRSSIEDGYEKAIIDDILNLLPKNLNNKDNNQAKAEVVSKINNDKVELDQNSKRKAMGLPPLRKNFRG